MSLWIPMGLFPAVRAFYMDRYFRLRMGGTAIGFISFYNTLPMDRLMALYFWIHPVLERSANEGVEESRRKVNIFTYASYITIILFIIFVLVNRS